MAINVIPWSVRGLGQERPQLPPSLIVPAVVGVSISLLTMLVITYGLAVAVSREEERRRG
jgi:hypothetical protein